MGAAAGAALVYFHLQPSRKFLDGMLGFAAGVMLAASCFSLLIPAIEISSEGLVPSWMPVTIGFVLGGLSLRLVDSLLPHLHASTEVVCTEDEDCNAKPKSALPLFANRPEGISTTWRRTTLLVLAITMHNIPEGLAVGVAFGAIASDMPYASLSGAIALTLGMGMQNLPEGMAVSFPLRLAGLSPSRSFWWGQFSGLMEPAAAVLGAIAVLYMLPFLPYALAFAAGAMIYVVVEEVIPEAQHDEHNDQVTLAIMLGFVLMMVLDVALG